MAPIGSYLIALSLVGGTVLGKCSRYGHVGRGVPLAVSIEVSKDKNRLRLLSLSASCR